MMYKICSAFFTALAIGSVSAEFGTLRTRNLSSEDGDCYKCSEHDPCGNNDNGFYEHCNKHKYIQCSNGYCYDMKCPAGLVWDAEDEACGYGKAGLGSCGSCDDNPCTRSNIKAGKYYHPHCDKKKKYLQCGAAVGVCYEMDCAEGTVWDEDEGTCVAKGGQADLGPCGDCEDNPCTEENIKDDKYYHPHCDKKRKYLQCGAAPGMCYERTCGEGTKWDQDLEACSATGGHDDLEPCGDCEDNPCTEENLEDDKYFHPHCDKKKKYLQCGAAPGMCYERTCGDGLKWDEDQETCA